ncbi:MAG: hypothetical protein SGPRY_012024 [Prymnesium sp.]
MSSSPRGKSPVPQSSPPALWATDPPQPEPSPSPALLSTKQPPSPPLSPRHTPLSRPSPTLPNSREGSKLPPSSDEPSPTLQACLSSRAGGESGGEGNRLRELEGLLAEERASSAALTSALAQAHALLEAARSEEISQYEREVERERSHSLALAKQREEFESRYVRLTSQLRELRASEDSTRAALASLRLAVHREVGREAREEGREEGGGEEGALLDHVGRMDSRLREGRGGSLGKRMERLLGSPTPLLATQIEAIVERCEQRVKQAEAAAERSRGEAEEAWYALQAAPTGEELRAQAEQAREARAAATAAEAEMRKTQEALDSLSSRLRSNSSSCLDAKASRVRGRVGRGDRPLSREDRIRGVGRAEAARAAAWTVEGEVDALSSQCEEMASGEALLLGYLQASARELCLDEGLHTSEGLHHVCSLALSRLREVCDGARLHIPLLRAVRGIEEAVRTRQGGEAGGRVRRLSERRLDSLVREVEMMLTSDRRHDQPPSEASAALVSRLMQELDVPAAGQILPRVRQLVSAARTSLGYHQQLRSCLELRGASMAECVHVVADVVCRNRALESKFQVLCQLLQVHSMDALLPSVHRLVGHPCRGFVAQ